jgi:hypothetical protein
MGAETKIKDIGLGQFELPLLFYILIALALPCDVPTSVARNYSHAKL